MSANNQLKRLSESDRRTLETIGMKLEDEQGELRPWEQVVVDFVRDVWPTLTDNQKTDAELILALIRYRLEHGFTWG